VKATVTLAVAFVLCRSLRASTPVEERVSFAVSAPEAWRVTILTCSPESDSSPAPGSSTGPGADAGVTLTSLAQALPAELFSVSPE
jgi:hypothetical protein